MRIFFKSFLTCLLSLLPHAIAQDDQSVLNHNGDVSPQPYRVAIIGAGAAGSSAAFHLSQFANTSEQDLPALDITIFEATDHIGGRTTTVNAFNDPRYPVELGASIFVEINAILFNATRDFNLPANNRIYESTGADFDLGIWDGDGFVFTVANRDEETGDLRGTLGDWWDIAKLLWKYGLGPIRLRTLQQSTIAKFLRIYDEVFPFRDLTKAVEDVNLLETISQSGAEMLAKAGVGGKFSREIIQASSRVNYAQNLNDFHGLETMVCMSTEGAMSIEGGNWQIFDQMVKKSGATVEYNTTVQAIEYNDDVDRTSVRHFRPGLNTSAKEFFDAVILAAPYNTSSITVMPPPANPPKPVDYVSLHVTLFTSPHRPSPSFFSLPKDSAHLVPDTILTTLPSFLDPSFLGRGIEAVGPTQFWSLSTLRTLHPSTDGFIPSNVESGHIPLENLEMNSTQYLYKIFSPAPLDTSFMAKLFGWHEHGNDALKENQGAERATGISAIPKDLISWSHEKTWNSYPYLPPTTEFDCFDMYDCGSEDETDQNAMGGRLWYTSGMERFISTMETSALAGRNVARLIVDRLEKDVRAREMKGTDV